MEKQTFPTLFKKSSTGALLQWSVFVEDNKFWSEYGQVGGKIQTDLPTHCESKNTGRSNETSPEAQAFLEAQSKWKRQQEFNGYVVNKKDLESSALKFKPMLAHKYLDHAEKLPDRIFVSPKLDGIRLCVNSDGGFSRGGKRFVATKFIEQDLAIAISSVAGGLIIDGEIYNHKYKDNFNKIISLSKKMKNISKDEWNDIEKNLQFHIFDFFFIAEPNLSFSERFSRGIEILTNSQVFSNGRIFAVGQHEIPQDEIEDWHGKYLQEGYEGVMARDPRTPYQFKRSYFLQKLKIMQDEEFKILDIIEGIGNRAGMFGKALLKTKDGLEFESAARGDEEYFRELLINKDKYIGKMSTVRFQNYTPAGKPRFGVLIAIRDYE